MICFFLHYLAYFGRFLSAMAKCSGKSTKIRTFCQIDAFKARIALTLMFLFENVLFYVNGNGDYLSRSRKSVIQMGIQNLSLSVKNKMGKLCCPINVSISYNLCIFCFIASDVPIYIHSNTALFTLDIKYQF